jgi:hypothetical protein
LLELVQTGAQAVEEWCHFQLGPTQRPGIVVSGLLKQVAHKVRRWRSGSMALRWGVTGMMEAERRFRRVKGYRETPQLLAALETKIASKKVA